MRRLAMLLAGGAFWLSVAALPVLGDGGPHTKSVNSGTSGLNGDCAACHRAHTAQAADLLKDAVPGLCLACHDGTGATTDVVDGYQYVPGSGNSQVLGALRGGGFSYALIDTSSAARTFNTRPSLARGHVGVLPASAKQVTTSAHASPTGTAWGNGPTSAGVNAGAGPVVLDCTKCHNPHGNGQYRILDTTPGGDWTTEAVAGWAQAGQAVEVADGPALTAGQVRNYTILPGTLAGDVTAAGLLPQQGDYWRRQVPDWKISTARDPMQTGWDGLSPTNATSNGGTAPDNRTGLMTAWCVACHTRYSGEPDLGSGLTSDAYSSGDAVFAYRHDTSTATGVGCEQCHVSHGSNALMTAQSSLGAPDPAGLVPPSTANAGTGVTVSGDSRLLKLDNRGTCQMCHDPTSTVASGSYVGPQPTPAAP